MSLAWSSFLSSAFALNGEFAALRYLKYQKVDVLTHNGDLDCNLGDLDWARFIDGAWSHHDQDSFGSSYADHMLAAWDWLHKSDFTLDAEHVLELQNKACNMTGVGGHFRGDPAYGNIYHLKLGKCIVALSNLDEILADIPSYLVHVTRDGDGRIDYVEPGHFNNGEEVKDAVGKVISNYQADLTTTISPLLSLSRFVRSLAWLHAFGDCNGRTRTLLMQWELERLQLGCGAFMFNNNRIHYFLTAEQFVRRIEEGMLMAEVGVAMGSNPWNQTTRSQHEDTFPIDPALKDEDCEGSFELENLVLAEEFD